MLTALCDISTMKIWRIAILTGAVVAIGILLLFIYQIYLIDNTAALEGLISEFGSAHVGLPVITIFIFLFVVALISFPAFWVLSLPWALLPIGLMIEGKGYIKKLDKFHLISLLISASLIAIIMLFTYYAQLHT